MRVEFWAPGVIESGGAQTVTLVLYRDTTVLGQVPINTGQAVAVTVPFEPVYAAVYDTPAAGAHTYKVYGFVPSNTGTVVAGAGGSGAKVPAFLRVVGAGV